VTATLERRRARPVGVRTHTRAGRTGYLIGALCIAISTVMLLPLVVSVLASVKPTAEAAASPPTYLPHSLSLDSYQRLWTYQQGLPTYLFNSLGTALLAIAFTLLLTVPAAYALARFRIPGKEVIFVVLLLALIVPYQALLTPPSSCRSASMSCATASAPSPGSWRRRRSWTARPPCRSWSGSWSRPRCRRSSPWPCSPSSCRGTSSSAPS
jgi:uncharacterized membrane protein YhaH (DUF805 family)